MLDVKDLLNLGGVFVLAMVLLKQISSRMDKMADQNVKILTLLTVLVKVHTMFDGVESVLNNDADSVAKKLGEAERAELVPGPANG